MSLRAIELKKKNIYIHVVFFYDHNFLISDVSVKTDEFINAITEVGSAPSEANQYNMTGEAGFLRLVVVRKLVRRFWNRIGPRQIAISGTSYFIRRNQFLNIMRMNGLVVL